MAELIARLEQKEEIEDIETLLKEVKLSEDEFSCVHALLVFIRADSCKELYIGGVEGSTSLLRLLCEETIGAGETDGLDMICEYCLPTTPITTVACVRKNDALNLVGAFWRRFPASPVLVEVGKEDDGESEYGYVLCGIEGIPDTWGPFDLNNWRMLRRRDDDAKVTFMTPRPVPRPRMREIEQPDMRRQNSLAM